MVHQSLQKGEMGLSFNPKDLAEPWERGPSMMGRGVPADQEGSFAKNVRKEKESVQVKQQGCEQRTFQRQSRSSTSRARLPRPCTCYQWGVFKEQSHAGTWACFWSSPCCVVRTLGEREKLEGSRLKECEQCLPVSDGMMSGLFPNSPFRGDYADAAPSGF